MSDMTEKDLAAIYANIFGSDGGKVILKDLYNKTEGKSTFPSTVTDGQAMALMMAAREGENMLYRYIKQKIKRGNKGE